MTHIAFQTLIDYVEDQLQADHAAEVTAHLTDCAQCQGDLTLARQFLTNARGQALHTPQSGLLRRALAAFRQQQKRIAQRPPQSSNLQYDNWQQYRLTGARGLPAEHQLLYQTDGYDIDLQITHEVATQSYVLRGQILTTVQPQAATEGSAIHLTDNATVARSALADHLGRFQFSYLPKGVYTLTVSCEAADIIIRAVDVGSAA